MSLGITTLSPWWGIGVMMLVGGVLGSWSVWRRDQSARRERVDDLVLALCLLNEKVAGDPGLARLLIVFTEAPMKLDRIERVRARAWFDSARRLHRLLHAALGREVPTEMTRSIWTPSMGEPARGERDHATPDGDLPPDHEGVSNITLIDPEFMAWVEAMREVRSG